MGKLFRTIDGRFKEIGFKKIYENEYGVRYERFSEKHEYTHIIHLGNKKMDEYVIQSYIEFSKPVGVWGTPIKLTEYETELCLKKMKKKGWR